MTNDRPSGPSRTIVDSRTVVALIVLTSSLCSAGCGQNSPTSPSLSSVQPFTSLGIAPRFVGSSVPDYGAAWSGAYRLTDCRASVAAQCTMAAKIPPPSPVRLFLSQSGVTLSGTIGIGSSLVPDDVGLRIPIEGYVTADAGIAVSGSNTAANNMTMIDARFSRIDDEHFGGVFIREDRDTSGSRRLTLTMLFEVIVPLTRNK